MFVGGEAGGASAWLDEAGLASAWLDEAGLASALSKVGVVKSTGHESGNPGLAVARIGVPGTSWDESTGGYPKGG